MSYIEILHFLLEFISLHITQCYENNPNIALNKKMVHSDTLLQTKSLQTIYNINAALITLAGELVFRHTNRKSHTCVQLVSYLHVTSKVLMRNLQATIIK